MSADEGSPVSGGEDQLAGENGKPRLTDDQKKKNHIASEKKRRNAIRQQYDRLTEIVPGLQGLSRSEGTVLRTTVDFIHTKLQERQQLIAQIEAQGGRVDEKLKAPVVNYKGPPDHSNSSDLA